MFKCLLVLLWMAVEITKNKLDLLTWFFFLTNRFSVQDKYKVFSLKKIKTKKKFLEMFFSRENFPSLVQHMPPCLWCHCWPQMLGYILGLQTSTSHLLPAFFAAHCNLLHFLKCQCGCRNPLPSLFTPRCSHHNQLRKGQGSWKWLNISLSLGHLSFPDLWLKWDKPADPQVAGLHWSMVVLCLNCSESTPGHLRCLNGYVCIISYGLSLYHKLCPMMPFWILFPNPGTLLA